MGIMIIFMLILLLTCLCTFSLEESKWTSKGTTLP